MQRNKVSRRNQHASSSRPHMKTSSARHDEPTDQPLGTDAAGGVHSLKLTIGLLCVLCGILNSYHQYTMFENDRHFSHLSTLEREMTFRTEMGLYYSYFKTLIEAKSFPEGLYNITHDRLTEYPNTINTLKRFNLYPEVILGALYRIFMFIADYFHLNTKQCWEVNRGDDLPPVESCEGLGEPPYFYITCIFLWNGLLGFLIFFYGQYLSNSVTGGIIAIASFFYNHGECTRVQWTPPLRESFAYPLFLGQMLMVSHILRSRRTSWKHTIILSFLTMSFFLCWQFAQFALLTQTLSVALVYILGFSSYSTVKSVFVGQLLGFGAALLLLFGNKMLLASLFLSTLLASLCLLYVDGFLQRKVSSILRLVVDSLFIGTTSLGLKVLISFVLGVKDDAHIWNILKSKFTSYKDFHTMLYTCSAEFDFMEIETPKRLTMTLLLPSVTCVLILLAIMEVKKILKWTGDKDASSEHGEAEIVYNVFQLGAFFIMAVLIMRLKLFFTPHLCIISSLLASRKYVWFIKKKHVHQALVFALLAAMTVEGSKNIKSQRSILGEYSNPELEELINWVTKATPTDAVFAGSMPTMANLMLSTRRPIVNHPHYEDAELRNRVYKVYMLYSRKRPEEVYQVLSEMGVQYAVIEHGWCYGRIREGCEMSSIWDIEDPSNRGNRVLCQQLFDKPMLFRGLFRNAQYGVLQL